jgi:uncharacterized protein YceH (UPF0502 family)
MAITLTPDECRVLGVLIEKAQTTPQQYPLSLNAVLGGANQKSNRDPVLTMTEDRALTALDGLRTKNLAREVMLSSSRVEKYRHVAREALEVDTSALVVLAELLLRGPQTVGEIRGRASRMHPLESIEIVSALLEHLMERDPPLVRSVSPLPGSRATRYAQLLCPDLHPLDASATVGAGHAPGEPTASAGHDVIDRLDRLERELDDLKKAVQRITVALGEPEFSAE